MSNEMNLIMENWRKFSETEKDLVLEDASHKLRVGLITEEKFIQRLITESEKEIQQLINEGVLSAVGGAVKGAVQKIIAQAVKLLNRALQIVKTAKEKVVGFIGTIISFVERFAKKHPTLFKAILAIASAIAIAAALGMFNEAHAAVKVGNAVIDPNSVEGKVIKGVLVHIDNVGAKTGNVELSNMASNLISKINSSKMTDLQEGNALTALAKKVMKVADIIMQEAAKEKESGGGVYEALKAIYTAGKETTLEYIGTVGNMLQGTGTVGKVANVGQQAIDAVAQGRVYES